MSKDEWYEKLREWARDDARLGKLPFVLMSPLAEHLANYEAVEHTLAPDGGERRRLLRRIETLAWILIESAQKGYISSNDVDLANDHLNKAQMALQTPTAGKA